MLAPQHLLDVMRGRLSDSETGRGSAATDCQVIEALYDPGRQVRVAYVLSFGDPIRPQRAWPDGDIVSIRHPVRRPMSRRGSVVAVNGYDFEVYWFPNDRRLRGLRKFAKRESAANVWQGWLKEDEPAIEIQPDTLRRSLVRYVPEQKWIVQLRVRGYDALGQQPAKRAVAVRSADVEACRELYSRTTAFRRAFSSLAGAFRIPRPVALDERLGLLAVEWSWGRSLTEVLQTSPVARTMIGVATGLQRFHQARPERLPQVTPDDYMASAIQCGSEIATVLPALTATVEELLKSLVERQRDIMVDGSATIHNDFHPKQLRIKRDRVTVLDLDCCAVGDPHVDVATFTAQLSMLGVTSQTSVSTELADQWQAGFLDAWQTVTGQPVDRQRLRWYGAVALLTMARGALRHLRPGWPQTVESCIQRAQRLLSRRDRELFV